MALHVFGHVELNERLGIAEHRFRQRFGEQSLADARGPKEGKGADWPARIFEISARTAERFANGGDGFVLPDDHTGHLIFHGEQALSFVLFHPLERNAGPFGHDVQNVLFVDFDALFFAAGAPGGQNSFLLFFGLLFLIAHGCSAFEVLLFDGLFLAGFNLFDIGFEVFDLRRPSHGANPRARAGFVHEVDRLIRQIAVGDITVGKFDRGFESRVGDFCLVMLFVFGSKSFENKNGLFNRRRFDFHALKTAFQRGVFLDVFAVLVERGGADALHFTSAERGLDDVRGIHGAFSRAGADDGVQFVYEQNDIFRPANFVHHRFDALFELAAVLCAGDHQRKVQSNHPLVAQELRNVAFGDFLSEAFNNRRLTNSGFPQQNGIILSASAENLNNTLDLVLAANDRVHLAFASDLGEVAAEGFESRRFDFAFLFRRGFFGSLRRAGRLLFLRAEVGVQFL